MSRRDRIASLPAPPRDRTFPAWPVMLDLDDETAAAEGRGGTAGLCGGAHRARRARLRFLVLRVARRLLDRGPGAVPADSFARQIDAVEAELGAEPAKDPERARLARLLAAARLRSARLIASAAIDVVEGATEDGHAHAAVEYGLTAADLAEGCGAGRERARALRALARAYRLLGRRAEAEAAERLSAVAAGTRAATRADAEAAPSGAGRAPS